jgi:[ribosomal protein S18]-alanine N-acetyltransferase
LSAQIRAATLADLDALVALEESFAEEDRFSRRTWARLLKGNTISRVVEAEGKLIASGNVLLRRGLDMGRLYSLSVAPEARGLGLARRLLAALEEAAASAGCSRMRLEVRAGNAAARALYDSSGYRVITTLDAYYPDGEAAARMEKHL